jgi:DNA-binding transcriptional ArsR family regulator
METSTHTEQTAELFKVLGHAVRLDLLQRIAAAPRAVGVLAQEAGLSQPLASQHLRSLRQAGLVRGDRRGREVVYSLADQHVAHVVEDALAHVAHVQSAPEGSASISTDKTADTTTKKENAS